MTRFGFYATSVGQMGFRRPQTCAQGDFAPTFPGIPNVLNTTSTSVVPSSITFFSFCIQRKVFLYKVFMSSQLQRLYCPQLLLQFLRLVLFPFVPLLCIGRNTLPGLSWQKHYRKKEREEEMYVAEQWASSQAVNIFSGSGSYWIQMCQTQNRSMRGNKSRGFWPGNIIVPCDFHLCKMTGLQTDINKKQGEPKSHQFDEPNKKLRWEERCEEYFLRLYTGK